MRINFCEFCKEDPWMIELMPKAGKWCMHVNLGFVHLHLNHISSAEACIFQERTTLHTLRFTYL